MGSHNVSGNVSDRHEAPEVALASVLHGEATARMRLRLPAMRGLRASSAGVEAEALRRCADGYARRARRTDQPDPSRVPVQACLVAIEPTTRAAVPKGEVLVEVDGAVVGRLPSEHAPMWHGTISRAQEAGVSVTCAAVLTLPSANAAASLVLRVCEPAHLRMMLTTPQWALPLLPECTVTLSGARLTSELIAHMTTRMVDWVTLHPVTISSGRHVGQPSVEVRLEGQRVGEFSAAAGARYRPVVEAAAQADKTPLARARLRADDLWAELDVLMPRPL